jgi:hypothetical protein
MTGRLLSPEESVNVTPDLETFRTSSVVKRVKIMFPSYDGSINDVVTCKRKKVLIKECRLVRVYETDRTFEQSNSVSTRKKVSF